MREEFRDIHAALAISIELVGTPHQWRPVFPTEKCPDLLNAWQNLGCELFAMVSIELRFGIERVHLAHATLCDNQDQRFRFWWKHRCLRRQQPMRFLGR